MRRLRSISARLRQVRQQRPVGDTLRFQVGQVVVIVAQGLTSLILLRVLGPDLVGVYAVATAMVVTARLLDLTGANRQALTEMALARGAGADERLAPALAAFLRVSVLVRMPLVATVFALAPAAATAAYGTPDAGLLARWLVLPLLFDLPYDLLVMVLHAQGQVQQVVRIETARALLIAAATAIVLLLGWGLAGLVTVRVAVSLAALGWSAFGYQQIAARVLSLPSWPRLLGEARSVEARSRLRAGVPMALEKALGNLGNQLPVLLLGAMHTGAVGYYAAAVRLMAVPAPLVSALARTLDVLMPFRAGQSSASLRRTFVRATLWSGLLWTPVTIVTAAVAPVLLIAVAGEAYRPSLPVIYPLVLQSLAVGAGVGISAALRSAGRPAYGVALQLLSLAVVVPLGVVLIDRWDAAGAGWFHALRYTLFTTAGIATVLWLLSRRRVS